MGNIDYRAVNAAVGSGSILFNEPMKRYTTFKVGGPADCMVIPSSKKELTAVLKAARDNGIPYYIVGNGSNLLVSDDGYRGLIILIRDRGNAVFSERELEDGRTCISTGAGTALTALSNEAASKSLTGLEFAAGIPGTVGGAVVMNAGAYGGEIRDVITDAEVIAPDGTCLTLTADELELGYRHSIIPEKGYIVIGASFTLPKGNADEIRARMQELNAQRRAKQPLEYPSAGSTFKRPEGYFAGKLIDDAGLRGFAVGGACVSEKHAGFVINRGDATAEDIRRVIEQVSDRVFAMSSVRLEPEVKMLGFGQQ